MAGYSWRMYVGSQVLKHYHWMHAKGYITRTQISIGGEQNRGTLMQQSPNYSNRTFSISSAISTNRCIYAFSKIRWFIYKACMTMHTCTTEKTLKFNFAYHSNPSFDIFVTCSYFAFVSTGYPNRAMAILQKITVCWKILGTCRIQIGIVIQCFQHHFQSI